MALPGSITDAKTHISSPGGVWAVDFVSNSREAFALSSRELIRGGERGWFTDLVVTAFQFGSKALAETLPRRNFPVNAPRLPFLVRRHRPVHVDSGVRARRGRPVARSA